MRMDRFLSVLRHQASIPFFLDLAWESISLRRKKEFLQRIRPQIGKGGNYIETKKKNDLQAPK